MFTPLALACIALSILHMIRPSVSSPLLSSIHTTFVEDLQTQSASTCADPSLTDIAIQAYSVDGIAHILDWRWVYVATNDLGTDWQFQAQSFRAWDTPQPFTVPLYRLVSTGATLDFMYTIGTVGAGTDPDAAIPPTAPTGWIVDGGPFAWVYGTQTCGSVPLMGVANAAASDHWYTTDNKERNNFINGAHWADAGVVAYVLQV